MNIAFFDSGMGGLTVLEEAIQKMPNENYIYYADLENIPYGTKSNKAIKTLTFAAVEFLVEQDLKALVIACNTATSVAVKELREKYDFPIIGMEPAVKLALKNKVDEDKRILVCATDLTLKEEKLHNLVVNLGIREAVDYLSLQELVVMAEDFAFEQPETLAYLQAKLGSLDWSKYSAIVLGCTHFLYFKALIRAILPANVQVLDGNEGTVRHLEKLITHHTPTSKTSSPQYFISNKAADAGIFERYMVYLKGEE